MPPIIGLNTTFEMDPAGGLTAIHPRYWESIVAAGGVPMLLPQLSSPDDIRAALDRVDAFVMIGGYDIPGERFGQKTVPTVIPVEPKREQADFKLLNILLESTIPTLAICLAFQELNVLRGGTLYQDVLFDGPPTNIRHYSKNGEYPRHEIDVAPDSLLAEAIGGAGKHTVNSSHHQAIAKLGAGLRATATAPDGIVEAIEVEGHPYFLAVQWHPERMPESREQQQLFKALTQKAARSV